MALPRNTMSHQVHPLFSTTRITVGVAIALGLFVLVTIFSGLYRIEVGERGVVKRFGQIHEVVDPGLHVKIPYADTVEHIEIRERAFSTKLEAASKDPMELPVGVTVNWMVKADHVGTLYSQYGSLEQFEKRIIAPRLPDAVKGVTSQYTVNDLLRKRVEYRDASLKALIDVMPDDIQITGFAVTDVGFPIEYTKSIRDKQVARENAETEEYRLLQQKFVAQQVTQSAQAQADANRALADAEAYKIRQQGEAQGAAISAMGVALASNPRVVEYEKIKKWGGEFPTTFMGGDQAANILWKLPSEAK